MGSAAGTPRPVRGLRSVLSLASALLLAASGCSGEGGTQPAPTPAVLVRLSSAVDTVAVGEVTDPPLSVRVENSMGDPMEGIPVRFGLVEGPGEVLPGLAVTQSDGVAEARFLASSEFGETRIRVDVPSASNIFPLEIQVVTIPARVVVLTKSGGDGQVAEAGSQLFRPFELEVTAESGVPAGGVAVVWEVTEGSGPEARMSADTTYTDGDGRTDNLLTLSSEPGDHAVRVFATGGVATDTVRFRAEAVTALSGPATVDSVAPRPLVAGGEATLFGSGLGPLPDDVELRVEGVVGEVLELESDGVRFRVPSFSDRCLPTRSVGVRALVRGEPSNGITVTLEPEDAPLELAEGEIRTFRDGGAADCLRIDATETEREYSLIAGTGARTAETVVPMRLLLRAGEAESTGAPTTAIRGFAAEVAEDETFFLGPEVEIRERARRELAGWRVVSPTRLRAARGEAATLEAAPPSRGDTLSFNFAVGEDLQVTCEGPTETLSAVVRAVGSHVVLAEDLDAPADGFQRSHWEELRDELDEHVVPTDIDYFGSPADIDGNGRITVLLTPEVNALTPRGSTAQIGGFFLPLDLTDSGDEEGDGVTDADGRVCPASNEGELVYLRTADPGGQVGDPLPVSQALRVTRTIAAHEIQHLLSAEQRVVFGGADFTSLEEVWLAEGEAHIAEEVAGLTVMGRGLRENVGWNEIIGDRLALRRFNSYHLDNFARLSFYMRAPQGVPVLSADDPGGIVGLQMRGFAWSFLRWVATQRATGDEAALFRDLSAGGGGQSQGIANVERAVGVSWEDLLAEYRAMLVLDDGNTESVAPRLLLPTWNLRSIFDGLHENRSSGSTFPLPYPLAATPLEARSSAVDFEVRASTASFFHLGIGSGDASVALQIRSQSGGSVSPATRPMVTVIRTR